MGVKIRWKIPKPGDRPGFKLWRTHNLWQRKLKEVLNPFKLTHVQYILLEGLSWLSKHEGTEITQSKLSETLGADAMMTSVVIRGLIKKDLVARVAHPTDTRANCVQLTALGDSLLQEAIRAVDIFEDAFFAEISTERFQKKLSTLLNHS